MLSGDRENWPGPRWFSFRCRKRWLSFRCRLIGIPAIPASHAFIHGKKVAIGLLTQLVLEGRPQTEIEEIYRYQKAVGLPITLAEVGVDVASDDQLRTIAERTVIPGESSLNEPFPVTAETLVPALRAADQLGRQRC